MAPLQLTVFLQNRFKTQDALTVHADSLHLSDASLKGVTCQGSGLRDTWEAVTTDFHTVLARLKESLERKDVNHLLTQPRSDEEEDGALRGQCHTWYARRRPCRHYKHRGELVHSPRRPATTPSAPPARH